MKDYQNRSYKDIIQLPHPQSSKHRHMSAEMRAAQFAPFAALTGYDAVIDETARLTDKKIELDDESAVQLSSALLYLSQNLKHRPMVRVCYFEPDLKKQGGAYVYKIGNLRVVDTANRILVFADGDKINIDDLISVEEQ